MSASKDNYFFENIPALDMEKCKLRVIGRKLKSSSWNSKVRVQTLKFNLASYEFKSTSYEFKSTSYEFISASYEFKSTSYEFKFTSSRFLQSMKTQVNNLENSLFPKILSLKQFSKSWGNSYVFSYNNVLNFHYFMATASTRNKVMK